jgi:flagellar protein FlaF
MPAFLWSDYRSLTRERLAKIHYTPEHIGSPEQEHADMRHAINAYAKTAKETANPRDLEAILLLEAAAKLQKVHDEESCDPSELNAALLYNRRLWTILLDAVVRDDNRLPLKVRQNVTRLGAYVMGETFSMMTRPSLDHLKAMIKVNRSIATGLRAAPPTA